MSIDLLNALSNLADVKLLGLIFLGVTVGMIGGALPGVSSSITIALLLPFAFTLEPLHGLIILGAIYMAAEYGGSISAILINTPGTPAAVCTGLDGHPLARRGKANEALHAAILASCIGGLIGVVILIAFTPPLALFALKFGSPEMFWLAIAGISIVCNLTAKNFVKGVVSTMIGMLIATVGYDLQTGYPRFSFGIHHLASGLQLVPCVIGFFAVSEMLDTIAKTQPLGDKMKATRGSFMKMLRFVSVRPLLVLQSGIIGTFVGILPGAGASIASFVSYSEARRFAREPDSFGSGNPEGVIASECANNAMVGGSLVPLLAFGIPGSGSAAVLFGAITLHGLVPGPRLFTENGETIYGFMVGFFPIVIAMLIVGAISAPWLASLLRTRNAYIVPAVLMLVLVGTYSFQGNMADVYVAAGTGVLGFFMLRAGFPLPPVVLGIILGPMAEEGFRRSLQLGQIDGSVWLMFFGRPICIVLILLTLTMIVSAFWREYRSAGAEQI